MAEHQVNPIFKEVVWMINIDPMDPDAGVSILDENDDAIEPPQEFLEQQVLPGRNFSIIYPIDYELKRTMTVAYDPEGQPVTLLDLLTSIYQFYDEPLGQGTRVDKMSGTIYFDDFVSVRPDVYRLKLT